MASSGLTVVALRLWVGSGGSLPVSPPNLILTLFAVALVLLLLSIPGWRYKKALLELAKNNIAADRSAQKLKPGSDGDDSKLSNAGALRPKRVDPFYAVRVLVLAKAVAITGAIFLGWHLGLLLHIWFSGTNAASTATAALWGVLGSLSMIAAALLSEWIWRLPDAAKGGQAKGSAADGAVAA